MSTDSKTSGQVLLLSYEVCKYTFLGGENAITMLGHCGWLPVHCYEAARGVSYRPKELRFL